jgi:hypothetical protein
MASPFPWLTPAIQIALYCKILIPISCRQSFFMLLLKYRNCSKGLWWQCLPEGKRSPPPATLSFKVGKTEKGNDDEEG